MAPSIPSRQIVEKIIRCSLHTFSGKQLKVFLVGQILFRGHLDQGANHAKLGATAEPRNPAAVLGIRKHPALNAQTDIY